MKTLQKNIFIILILNIAVFNFSCTVTRSYFSIEVLEPSKISVNQEINTILIVSNPYQKLNIDTSAIYNDFDNQKEQRIIESGAANALNSLATVLDDSPRFKYLIIKDLDLLQANLLYPKNLINWQLLDSVTKAYNAQAIVALCAFTAKEDKALKRSKNYYTPVYYGKYKVKTSYVWRIFNPSSQSIEDEYVNTHTAFWENNFYSKIATEKNMPDKQKTVKAIGKITGDEYGRRIAPRWVNEQRTFFAGHPYFNEADKYVAQSNWIKASEIWMKYSETQNNKLSAMACFNLALALEMQGNIDDAITWAEKALKFRQDRTIVSYLHKLNNRKKMLEILKSQMEQ